MKSQEFQSKLEEASSHENVNIATELVSQALIDACKAAGLKSQKQRQKENSYKQSKNWFDQECETEKENLKSLGKRISHIPHNVQLRTFLMRKRRVSKKRANGKMLVSLS